jgi:hypothetical protein
MTKAEIEARREKAVFEFLIENEGSTLITQKWDWALIRVGGLTRKQKKAHALMIIGTLGLWTPVFLAVALLRRDHEVLIRVWHSGYIERTIV